MGVVEYLDDEQLAPMPTGEAQRPAKLPIEHRLAPGDERTVVIPPEQPHLFGERTEQSIAA